MSEQVHILRITNKHGRLAFISLQFETPALKTAIFGALRRILPDANAGIPAVKIFDRDHPTTFVVQFLQPPVAQSVEGLIRALAKEHGFTHWGETITEEAYEDMALEILLGKAPDYPPD